jgi:hypothetical protein
MDSFNKKMAKKNGGSKANGNVTIKDNTKAQKAATFGGRREKTNYRQFFESSDDESDSKSKSTNKVLKA